MWIGAHKGVEDIEWRISVDVVLIVPQHACGKDAAIYELMNYISPAAIIKGTKHLKTCTS